MLVGARRDGVVNVSRPGHHCSRRGVRVLHARVSGIVYGGSTRLLLPHHLRRRVMSPPHPFQGQTTDDGGKAGQVRSEADCQVHRRGALPWRCFAILLCFALLLVGWLFGMLIQ